MKTVFPFTSTVYTYDDMGRVVSTTSPDTGTTFYVYDAAGNLAQKTDANGITVQYNYDELNRPIAVNFPDANQNIGYTYDQGAFGKGRRTGITDPAGSLAFGYDSRGRIIGKTGTVYGFTYPLTRTFSPGGRVIGITYPSGRTATYFRENCVCKINRVTTTYNSNTKTLVENLTFRPFGIADGMDAGSGGHVLSRVV